MPRILDEGRIRREGCRARNQGLHAPRAGRPVRPCDRLQRLSGIRRERASGRGLAPQGREGRARQQRQLRRLVRHPDGGREALALAVVFLARLARRRQALPEVACGGTQGAGTRQAHCRNTHVRLSGRTVLRVLSRLFRAGEGGVRGLLPRRGARFDELRVLLQADGAQGAGGVCA